MTDIIDSQIRKLLRKGKKVEVLKRLLRLKYRVQVDLEVLRRRVNKLQIEG